MVLPFDRLPPSSAILIAPERSGGASYSETGVSNDLGVRPMSVRKKMPAAAYKMCGD